jgi:hypothetical protein
MIPRKFNFPFSVLTAAASRLHAALIEADYATAMGARLDDVPPGPDSIFADRFKKQIALIDEGGVKQSSQTGDVGTLTQAQKALFEELERLTAGARRSARIAFPDDATKLRSEFQVGIDEPKDLDSELGRARKILAACRKYAIDLRKAGWIATDTDALAEVIDQLGGKSVSQDVALDERLDLTEAKIIAANDVYAACLRVQNAARLQYPSTKKGTATARARFLLDEFPPRDRSEPSGGTQPPSGPTQPPAGPTKPPGA